MTEMPGGVPGGVQAGRLEVPVVADLRGFAEKLRTGVQAAAAGLKAQVEATVSESSLGKARAEIEAGLKGITAEVDVRVDENKARETLQGVMSRLGKGLRVQVGVDADTAQAEQKVRRTLFDARGRAIMSVSADTTAATAQAEAARARIDSSRADIEVGADTSTLRGRLAQVTQEARQQIGARTNAAVVDLIGRMRQLTDESAKARRQFTSTFNSAPIERFLGRVGRGLMMFGIFTGIVALVEGLGSAITGLVGGLAAVVGGLYAIAAATGPAIAGLAVIPGLIAAAAQAGAVLIAAFSGVGKATSAILQSRKKTSGSAVTANRQVADSARQVATAERGLRSAQESAVLAQERLNDARREARERLEDLNLELRRGALDEESAAIGLERAKERLADVQANPWASDLDRREAELAYQEALLQVDTVAERNADLVREGAELRRKGVEGADEVVAAKRALRDALESELVAQEQLADAQRKAVEPVAALAGADTALADAMDGLSPAGRSFAYFLADELIPRIKQTRNAIADELLPTLEGGLRGLMTSLLPQVEAELTESARGAAGWFERLFGYLGSGDFSADFQIISDGSQRALANLGDAALSLLTVLTDITAVVSEPGGLLDRFTEWVKTVTAGWEATTQANRANGDMFQFFNRAGDVIGQWARILGNIATGLFNIGSAGSATGQGLLDTFEAATVRFVEWTDQNRGRLEEWFAAIKPIVENVGGLLVDITNGIAGLADDPNTAAMVSILRDQVGPAIGRLVEAFQNSDAGERFAAALTSIVDAFTAMVETGQFGKFFDTLGQFFDLVRMALEDDTFGRFTSGLLGFIGVAGAVALILGPLMRLTGVLTALARVATSGAWKLIQWLFGIGGGGAPGAARAVAGMGRGAGTAVAAGAGGAAAWLGSLFGRGGGSASASALESLSLYDGATTTGRLGTQTSGAAGAASASRSGSWLSRLAATRGGKVGIAAAVGGGLAWLFSQGGSASGTPPQADMFIDPETGLIVDPASGVVYDQSGVPVGYPSATPPAGYPPVTSTPPPPPQQSGFDGVSLALAGGSFALGARSFAQGGLQLVPRVAPSVALAGARTAATSLTPRAAMTGIRAAGGTALRALAGPVGWASMGTELLGHAISDGQGGFRDTAGSVLKGAGGGATIGALIGSVVPIIGTGVGAAVGAVVGGIVGYLRRPSAEMTQMRNAAQSIGENIQGWFRDGDQKGIARTTAEVKDAMAKVGAEVFSNTVKTKGQAAAFDEATRAMRTQYDTIKNYLMEAYGLTEQQVEQIIGKYEDYNAYEVVPKYLEAEDRTQWGVESAKRGIDEFYNAHPSPRVLEARDDTKPAVDSATTGIRDWLGLDSTIPKSLRARDDTKPQLDSAKQGLRDWLGLETTVPKSLQAKDDTGPAVQSATQGLTAWLNGGNPPPKTLTATSAGVTTPVGFARQALQDFNSTPAPSKNLTILTNAWPVVQQVAQAYASIPNTVVKRLVISASVQQSVMASTPGLPWYVTGAPRPAAKGLTVLPRNGGTLVQVAEAGRPETIVDEGLQNEMLRKVIAMLNERGQPDSSNAVAALTAALERQTGGGQPGSGSAVFAEGAIQVHIHNPVAETATDSISQRMRQVVTFGLEPALRGR